MEQYNGINIGEKLKDLQDSMFWNYLLLASASLSAIIALYNISKYVAELKEKKEIEITGE